MSHHPSSISVPLVGQEGLPPPPPLGGEDTNPLSHEDRSDPRSVAENASVTPQVETAPSWGQAKVEFHLLESFSIHNVPKLDTARAGNMSSSGLMMVFFSNAGKVDIQLLAAVEL